MRKKFLEPFEGKNLPQRWGQSEISRWSDQLENGIFRLPTFFSKVSKNFLIGHIAFIFFFTQTCLHSYIRPMKNLNGLWQNLRKIFGKNITPPKSRFGGVCKYIKSLTRVYPTWYKKWFLGEKYWRSLSIEKLTFLIK